MAHPHQGQRQWSAHGVTASQSSERPGVVKGWSSGDFSLRTSTHQLACLGGCCCPPAFESALLSGGGGGPSDLVAWARREEDDDKGTTAGSQQLGIAGPRTNWNSAASSCAPPRVVGVACSGLVGQGSGSWRCSGKRTLLLLPPPAAAARIAPVVELGGVRGEGGGTSRPPQPAYTYTNHDKAKTMSPKGRWEEEERGGRGGCQLVVQLLLREGPEGLTSSPVAAI